MRQRSLLAVAALFLGGLIAAGPAAADPASTVVPTTQVPASPVPTSSVPASPVPTSSVPASPVPASGSPTGSSSAPAPATTATSKPLATTATAKPTPPAHAVPAVAPTAPGSFVTLPPTRLLDTRYGVGAAKLAVPAGGTVDLAVAGLAGIPSTGVAATLLNVTVLTPAKSGYLTVWPDGTPRPALTNLDFYAGRNSSNLTVAQLGPAGHVQFYNGSAGPIHLTADVSGYYRAGAAVDPGSFTPLAPARVLDTRSGLGLATAGPVPAHGTAAVTLAGRGGLPASGVSAVAINLFAVTPAAGGALVAYPNGTSTPVSVNLYFQPGRSLAGLSVVKLGTDGRIALYNNTAAAVHYVADVVGYYRSGAVTGAGDFQPTSATRVLDTRTGLGSFRAAVAPNGTVQLALAGRGGVPSSGVSAVLVNQYALTPAAGGSLYDFAGGTAIGHASNGDFVAGSSVSSLSVVPVGADGTVLIHSNSSKAVQLLLDIEGYVLGDPTPAVTGQLTGQVTDVAGAALADVYVTVQPAHGTGTEVSVLSDSSGHFLATGLAPNDYGVYYDPDRAGQPRTSGGAVTTGWLGASGNVAPEVDAGATSAVSQKLDTAGAVHGKVVDQNGRPVAGAIIEDGAYQSTVSDTGLRTAADGSFLLRGLTTYSLSLCFNATTATTTAPGGLLHRCYQGTDAGYGNPYSTAGAPVTGKLGVLSELGTTVLHPGTAVSGRLTDPTGAAVPGIKVEAYPTQGIQAITTTAADGSYHFGGLGAGGYEVCVYPYISDQATPAARAFTNQCYATSYPYGRTFTTLAAGKARIDNFRLDHGGSISIKVTDRSGHPLSNVSMDRDNYTSAGTTGADGTLLVTNLEPGSHTLCLSGVDAVGGDSDVGYVSECYQHDTTGGGTPIAVTDDHVTSISTQLTPMSGAILTVTDPAGHPIAGITADQGRMPSDSNGVLEIPGLLPGDHTICLYAGGTDGRGTGVTGSSGGGYRDRCDRQGDDPPITLTVTGATPTRLTVVLNPLGGVTGTITDPHGHGLGYTEVDIYADGQTGYPVTQAWTDDNGVYHANRLEPGQYRVCFRDPYYGRGGGSTGGDSDSGYLPGCFGGPTADTATALTVGAGSATTADAALAYGGAVAGTVTDSTGHPVAGLVVSVAVLGGDFVSNEATTDANGRYSFGSLPTGSYQLCAMPLYNETDDGFNYIEQCTPASTDGPGIAVTAGRLTEDANISMDRFGGLSGVVTDDAGTALEGVSVDIEGQDGGGSFITQTGVGGRWYQQDLVAGKHYTVCFDLSSGGPSPLGYQRQCYDHQDPATGTPTPVAVQAQDRYTKDINGVLQRWGGISGTVTPAKGSRTIMVSLYQNGQPYDYIYVYTGDDGKYAFYNLPAGTYTVVTDNNQYCLGGAYTKGSPDGSPTPIAVTLGQLSDHIDISMTNCPYG